MPIKLGVKPKEEKTEEKIEIKSANDIADNDSTSLKLESYRGGGKTLFALLWVKSAWNRVYKSLYNIGIKEDYNNEGSQQRREEAAKRVMSCILDVDIDGVSKQVKRDDIIPIELRPRIFPLKVYNYDTMKRYLNALIDLLKKHKEQYPEYGYATFLHIEGGAKIWEFFIDDWIHRTDPSGQIEDISELREKKMRDQRRTGSFQTILEAGPREEFGGVNIKFIKFMDYIKFASSEYGFNLVYTVVVQEKDRYVDGKLVGQYTKITGRPELIDPYFDLLFRLEKTSEEEEITDGKRTVKKKVNKFYVDATQGKNRESFPFHIEWTNKTPAYIFEHIAELLKNSPYRNEY